MSNYAERLINKGHGKEMRVQIGRRLYKLVPAEKVSIKNLSHFLDKFDVRILTERK